MAVRAKNGGYEVYWRDPATGKQRGRYFRRKKEAEAEDRRIRHMLKYDRAALAAEFPSGGTATKTCSFRKVWERFHELNRWSLGDREVKGVQFVLSRIGDLDVSSLDTGVYVGLYEWLSSLGWKPQSVKRTFAYVNRVARFAKELGYLAEMPRPCRLPYLKAEEVVPPTKDEVSLLYRCAEPHLQRVIVLGAQFGIRVGPSELFSLLWSDVDLENWVIRLRAAKKTKEESVRTLPIPEAHRQLFLDWRRADGASVTHVVNYLGKPVKSIAGAWRGALRRSGIKRRLRPYDLRHAFATNMLEAGVDIGTVAKLMGHTTTQMVTKHYQYVREERKLDALSKLGPIV